MLEKEDITQYQEKMATFSIPYVASNPTSWGPPNQDDANPNAPASTTFADLPYSPFGRSDRIGRAADFTSRNMERRAGRRSTKEQQMIDEEADEDFQLVDTSKTTTTKRFVRAVENAFALARTSTWLWTKLWKPNGSP